MKKILLIVEGEKQEVNLFKRAFSEYRLDLSYEIYPYKTNIYELYERMFKGNESDLDSLDLLGILREKDPDTSILNESFSDIILVFDYEPQDGRFAEERIELMLSYFNESTDNGKLYINYPMIESVKHFKCDPDEEFQERMVDYTVLISKKYKELVGLESRYQDINQYSREHFNSVITQNILKALRITVDGKTPESIIECYECVEPLMILQKQNFVLAEIKKIFVLNTCLFFICDYNIKMISN